MKNKDIADLLDCRLDCNTNVQNIFKFISDKYPIKEEQYLRLTHKITKFESKFRSKWQTVHRVKDRFNSTFESWLKADFCLTEFIKNEQSASELNVKRGRPTKSFMDSSVRSKRRKIDEEKIDPKVDSTEKALLIARRTAYNRRDLNLVKVIGLVLKNQDQASRMFLQLSDVKGMMTPEEALEFFIDVGFSKAGYTRTHRECPSRFPCYDVIAKTKKLCAPPAEFIEESSSKIRVQLQALVNHTARRIVKMIETDIAEHLDSNDLEATDLTLLCSWGMDGSTGYSQYHQALPEGCQDDSDIFSSTMTPIQLCITEDKKHILWYNPMPQSIRFCRPIFLDFVKESKHIILKTKCEIENEILELNPVKIIVVGDKYIHVQFKFVLSMIDGKVLSYITETSSMQNCPICGATPNVMSDRRKFEEGYTSKEASLHYGISPLHAWLRFFGCLLHIAYRMDFKQWQV